ncbi:MAG: EAL and GGDEF domain-containing protein [Desulfobulbaceae bacterium]|nr:EAL and GGDEF domain-containing protein [Desulfobulbaceae bacterium]HIJ89889.1 EAL and GGDEF domain-containing protein [Deltaproteobacteria bacterium]
MPEKEAGRIGDGPVSLSRGEIFDLLDNDGLTALFQPVFSSRTGEIFGYEALVRLREERTPPLDIGFLFQRARAEGIIPTLDMLCRENAFRRVAQLGFPERTGYLYVNICPATLMHPDHRVGATDRLAEECGIAKERIILEITEQEAIRNYDLFEKSVEYYRKRGYKIAIDDFGVGYGGLKMLSVIEPDYVKIDRHFITNIDRDSFKHNLVDAIATVCHKLGITIVAEGIERPEELEIITRFDIDLLQGFLLERPGPTLSRQHLAPLVVRQEVSYCLGAHDTSCTIGATVKYTEPLSPHQSLMTAHQRFLEDVNLQGIPVVDEQRVLGMLNRMHFLEKQMVGPHGYGFALSAHRTVRDVLGDDFLLVEAATPIENVVGRIKGRKGMHLYDDICVARNGKYLGTVAINALLEAITQKSIQLAKGANPLSGLPGNGYIQRTVATLLQRKVNFDVCYIDIDDFKPYNDYYGFEKGDMVIQRIGRLIVDIVQPGGDDRFRFVGHIGGDDFIVITRPYVSQQICRRIIEELKGLLPDFHGDQECGEGFYCATDRQGQQRRFALLALSIGIVSTEECPVNSYAELAFLASEVKRAAKQEKGSAIVRNRREGLLVRALRKKGKAA